jgi:hypothetical protein
LGEHPAFNRNVAGSSPAECIYTCGAVGSASVLWPTCVGFRRAEGREFKPRQVYGVRMSELVKERVLRTLGEIRVSSSLTPRSIIVSRSLVDLKGLHGM